MTNTQYKAVGIIAMVVGVILLLIGGIGIADVHEAKTQLAQLDQMTQGLFGGMAKGMGASAEVSYMRPIIFIVFGIISGIVGFKLLGKASTKE